MRILRQFMADRPLLVLLRIAGMVTHISLLLFGAFQSAHGRGFVDGAAQDDIRWPIACFVKKNSTVHEPLKVGLGGHIGLLPGYGVVVTTVLIFYNFIFLIGIWLEQVWGGFNISRSSLQLTFAFFTAFLFNLVVAIAILIFSVVIIFELRGQVQPYLNGSEDEWSFGQIIPNILLIIPVFAALGSACDEFQGTDTGISWIFRLPHREGTRTYPQRLRRNDTESRYGDAEGLIARETANIALDPVYSRRTSNYRSAELGESTEGLSQDNLRIDAQPDMLDDETITGGTENTGDLDNTPLIRPPNRQGTLAGPTD
ncbi:hypothetical protein GP486_007887 [Trichoglossum hirsutum]|uniref:Uncharacterized protein n=1 Tax=Trichoglossum hirsutum TaxID=265104 RepID=A0A9P8L7F0_9PEZI|nr:hypothetical protein GP486_007887 [Trichoglossum hirsutum]